MLSHSGATPVVHHCKSGGQCLGWVMNGPKATSRGFVKSFARTMQRNHVSRIDFLECPDRISNVVLLIGREMIAPDHRMNFFHTRGDLSLPDRVDHAAMTARS